MIDSCRDGDKISDIGQSSEELLHLLRPPCVNLPARIRSVRESVEAVSHNRHRGLAAGSRDTAAVAFVACHHRNTGNGEVHCACASYVTVKRYAERRRTCLENSRTCRRNGVSSELFLCVGADCEYRSVNLRLICAVHADNCRGYYRCDSCRRFGDSLAAELRAAVEGEIDLVRSYRYSRGTHRSADRTVFGRDDHFNAGLSSVGVDLTSRYGFYKCSVHLSFSYVNYS